MIAIWFNLNPAHFQALDSSALWISCFYDVELSPCWNEDFLLSESLWGFLGLGFAAVLIPFANSWFQILFLWSMDSLFC